MSVTRSRVPCEGDEEGRLKIDSKTYDQVLRDFEGPKGYIRP